MQTNATIRSKNGDVRGCRLTIWIKSSMKRDSGKGRKNAKGKVAVVGQRCGKGKRTN
jgi:hypothetical protein